MIAAHSIFLERRKNGKVVHCQSIAKLLHQNLDRVEILLTHAKIPTSFHNEEKVYMASAVLESSNRMERDELQKI